MCRSPFGGALKRRRSTSSHEREELLHLRGLVHEAVRLVMPRPKVASSREEEGGEESKDGERNRKRRPNYRDFLLQLLDRMGQFQSVFRKIVA